MAKHEVKQISVGSILKIVPLVFLILGFLVGLISYLYLRFSPTAIAPRINFFEWILAIVVYAVIFCVVLSLLIIIGAKLYNVLSKRIGCIELEMSTKE
jgi:hypothetical protein